MARRPAIAMDQELLPCPFCGGVRVDVKSLSPVRKAQAWIECDDCHAAGPMAIGEDNARRIWNERGKRDE